jgi:hypothetical protein
MTKTIKDTSRLAKESRLSDRLTASPGRGVSPVPRVLGSLFTMKRTRPPPTQHRSRLAALCSVGLARRPSILRRVPANARATGRGINPWPGLGAGPPVAPCREFFSRFEKMKSTRRRWPEAEGERAQGERRDMISERYLRMNLRNACTLYRLGRGVSRSAWRDISLQTQKLLPRSSRRASTVSEMKF